MSDPPLLAVSQQSRRSHDRLSGQEVEGFPVPPLQAVLCEWPPHIKHAHLAFVENQSCVEFFPLRESNMFWVFLRLDCSRQVRPQLDRADSVALCEFRRFRMKLTIHTSVIESINMF